jgi:uncharacterized integral membrane protein
VVAVVVAVALTLLLVAVEAVDRLSSVKFLLLKAQHTTYQLVLVDMADRVQQHLLPMLLTQCQAA